MTTRHYRDLSSDIKKFSNDILVNEPSNQMAAEGLAKSSAMDTILNNSVNESFAISDIQNKLGDVDSFYSSLTREASNVRNRPKSSPITQSQTNINPEESTMSPAIKIVIAITIIAVLAAVIILVLYMKGIIGKKEPQLIVTENHQPIGEGTNNALPEGAPSGPEVPNAAQTPVVEQFYGREDPMILGLLDRMKLSSTVCEGRNLGAAPIPAMNLPAVPRFGVGGGPTDMEKRTSRSTEQFVETNSSWNNRIFPRSQWHSSMN